MAEAVEGGAALAWRVLATLEGGSLLLASSALLVYSVRNKITRKTRTWKDIRRVLVSTIHVLWLSRVRNVCTIIC